VPLWGVGNENWGCGGEYDAAGYAREYRRYASFLRPTDPAAELVACGYEDAWNIELLRVIGNRLDLVDHLSIHHYWTHGGPETAFSAAEYYALLAEAQSTEAFIIRTAAIIEAATGGRRRIGIALDEWGVWHPEARTWGPGCEIARAPVTYEQAGTLRDALAAAVALEGFHRQCRVLTLANLAQVVNVLHAPVMTDGPRMWLTPTYHVLRLHAPHLGATALPVEIAQSDSLPDGTSRVTATASQSAAGLAVTVINRHLDQAASVGIRAGEFTGAAQGQLLAADTPGAGNSAEAPDRVAPVPLSVAADGPDALRIELPPHAVATILIPTHS
jgi:alpha-N-arabinofuranosidase